MIDFNVNAVAEVVDFFNSFSKDRIIDKFTKKERCQKLLIYRACTWRIKCL